MWEASITIQYDVILWYVAASINIQFDVILWYVGGKHKHSV